MAINDAECIKRRANASGLPDCYDENHNKISSCSVCDIAKKPFQKELLK